EGVGAALRRHLADAGGGPARSHGGDSLGRSARPCAHRRHTAQPEVHAVPGGGRGRGDQTGATGARGLQTGRPSYSVQRGDGRHLAGGAARAGKTPRSDRPRGRLQRLLLRPDAGTAERDHRAYRTNRLVVTRTESEGKGAVVEARSATAPCWSRLRNA